MSEELVHLAVFDDDSSYSMMTPCGASAAKSRINEDKQYVTCPVCLKYNVPTRDDLIAINANHESAIKALQAQLMTAAADRDKHENNAQHLRRERDIAVRGCRLAIEYLAFIKDRSELSTLLVEYLKRFIAGDDRT